MTQFTVTKLINPWQKFIGLINRSTATSVYFETRFGIHTFGMKFPIDILILDKDNRVVVIKEKMFPGRIFFWNPIYNKVLELPPGTIRNQKIKKDTQIILSFSNSL